MRQIYSRHEDHSGARRYWPRLSSTDARTRWGATRVFAHHFSALAHRGEMVERAREADWPIRSFLCAWTPSRVCGKPGSGTPTQPFAAGSKTRSSPLWLSRSIPGSARIWATLCTISLTRISVICTTTGFLCLAPEPDRERAIRGRLSIEAQLAEKIARVLEAGPDSQKKNVLAALGDLPLAARRRLRSWRGPVEARAAGLQPHRQRYRADRVLRTERGPAREGAAAAARLSGSRRFAGWPSAHRRSSARRTLRQ